MPYISVVTPLYNAIDIVDELYRQLVEYLSKITDDFEIVMVNDADPTHPEGKVLSLCQQDKRIKFINFSRNFGQHVAISAGLDYAEGDYVVVMDCDLQDPPAQIPLLYDHLKKSGKEVCFAVRENRKDSFIKIFYSKCFKFFMNKLTDKIFISKRDAANFSIISRKVVLEFRKLREKNRSYQGLVRWCGFDFEYVNIEFMERFAGKSGYNFFRSLKHAFDIVLQQSVKPLYISVFFSVLFFAISVFFAGFIVYRHFTGYYGFQGYASVMCAITFISSLIFLTLAVMSMYLANIFQEQHKRPLYVIDNLVNLEDRDGHK